LFLRIAEPLSSLLSLAVHLLNFNERRICLKNTIAIGELSDDHLIRLLNKGNREAFRVIYKRYAEKMLGFAAAKLFELEDAEDVLHDVFARLWAEREQLQITGSLQSYLFSAIRYRVVDKIRRNVTREQYTDLLFRLEEQYAAADERLRLREVQETIEVSLKFLPEKTRQIFRLSREENRSVAEIAVAMNLSEQTIKNQLTIALKHLRRSTGYTGIVLVLASALLK